MLSKVKGRYEFRGTEEFGIDTGRRRYRVTCLKCGRVVHPATTGPEVMAAQHDEQGCGQTSAQGA